MIMKFFCLVEKSLANWFKHEFLPQMLYVLRVILLMNNIPSYSTNPKSSDSYRVVFSTKADFKMDLTPRKLTTMKEDVFPIENRDFPAYHVIVFRGAAPSTGAAPVDPLETLLFATSVGVPPLGWKKLKSPSCWGRNTRKTFGGWFELTSGWWPVGLI